MYLGHITPFFESEKHITERILKYCAENSLKLDNFMSISCDETAVNNGRKNGAIAFVFQTKISRNLQWLKCQLHKNELPLLRLFSELDEQITGPRTFSCPIGKSLDQCER